MAYQSCQTPSQANNALFFHTKQLTGYLVAAPYSFTHQSGLFVRAEVNNGCGSMNMPANSINCKYPNPAPKSTFQNLALPDCLTGQNYKMHFHNSSPKLSNPSPHAHTHTHKQSFPLPLPPFLVHNSPSPMHTHSLFPSLKFHNCHAGVCPKHLFPQDCSSKHTFFFHPLHTRSSLPRADVCTTYLDISSYVKLSLTA